MRHAVAKGNAVALPEEVLIDCIDASMVQSKKNVDIIGWLGKHRDSPELILAFAEGFSQQARHEQGESPVLFGRFRILQAGAESLELSPSQALSEDVRVSMAFSPGPRILSDQIVGSWPSHYAENLADRLR